MDVPSLIPYEAVIDTRQMSFRLKATCRYLVIRQIYREARDSVHLTASCYLGSMAAGRMHRTCGQEVDSALIRFVRSVMDKT